MSALGIAAVIAALVSMLGLIDSFLRTVDRSEAELAGNTPSRVEVALDRFRPRGSEEIRQLAAGPTVAAAEPRIAVPARVAAGDASFDVGLQLVDYDSGMWRPTVRDGQPDPGGILLAEKAARDLGVGPGDSLLLSHPRRVGATAFESVETRVRVAGLHRDPFRTAAY